MLEIRIPEREFWDEGKQEFFTVKGATLRLEHSLISISKWESKWHVPFFDSQMTDEQSIDYIRCMSLDGNVSENSLKYLTAKNMQDIEDYLKDPMTATTISETVDNRNKQFQRVTSELIYYWMTAFNIPKECEKWHIARLITLIRVCSEENKPKKKMSNKDLMSRYRQINEANKKKFNTKG